MGNTRDFPALPRALKDVLELGQWLGRLKTWADALVSRVTALDQATVQQVSGDTVLDPTWDFVEYVGPGGHTLTLPSAQRAGVRRARVLFVENNGAAAITLAAAGGETIDGAASQPFGGQATTVVGASGGLVGLVSNGDAKWRAFGGLSAWVRIRNSGGSGAGTHVPWEVDDGGSRMAYIECGGGSPHFHLNVPLVTSGTLTVNGLAVILGAAAATLSIFGGPATARQAAINAAAGGATVDTECRALAESLRVLLGSGKFNLHSGS